MLSMMNILVWSLGVWDLPYFILLYSDNVTLKGHFHCVALFFPQWLLLFIPSQLWLQIWPQSLTWKSRPKSLLFFPRILHWRSNVLDHRKTWKTVIYKRKVMDPFIYFPSHSCSSLQGWISSHLNEGESLLTDKPAVHQIFVSVQTWD